MQGSARDFLKPKLVDSVEISKNEYRVVLEPFERGFGHTLGNSIRRTLLSSMVGSAITEVAIDGVMHEFSTIEGVQEDVLDILLNLKEASIGLNANDSASVIIEKDRDELGSEEQLIIHELLHLLGFPNKCSTNNVSEDTI